MGTLYQFLLLKSVCRHFVRRYFILMYYTTHHLAYEIGLSSVIHAFVDYMLRGLYKLIKFSTSVLVISVDVACLSGTTAKYLVSKSCIVDIYECPLSVVGSDPTISIDILSNAVPGISVRSMGCYVDYFFQLEISAFLYILLYFQLHIWPEIIMTDSVVRFYKIVRLRPYDLL